MAIVTLIELSIIIEIFNSEKPNIFRFINELNIINIDKRNTLFKFLVKYPNFLLYSNLRDLEVSSINEFNLF